MSNGVETVSSSKIFVNYAQNEGRALFKYLVMWYTIAKDKGNPLPDPYCAPKPRKEYTNMKFTFTCKKIALNSSIKEYAEKKISKLDRYFPDEAEAFVTFAVEKKNRCVVELTIRAANGTLFRAQQEDADGDMRGAIDAAVNYIDRKIRKNKTRLSKNLRAEALVPEVPAEFDVAEDTEFELVRTKRFAVKPMTTEEAILQMNLLGHNFYVFRSVETDTVSVVYGRKNGGYGLIETE